MTSIHRRALSICTRCLRARSRHDVHVIRRAASDHSRSPPNASEQDESDRVGPDKIPEPGAMTRRLQELSDESLETGGQAARKAVGEAGFSEDLKRELEKKIADVSFRSENASAFATHNLPASASKVTREIAADRPWAGGESLHAASLRMLQDAHKPLRIASRLPNSPRGPPARIDTGRPKAKVSAGSRIATARERSALYEQQQGLDERESLSDQERQKFREEVKARFEPGARAVPASIQGLTSLANKRIEDAIARGQFKNLPDRGKKMDRDYNASSPFINTTEYFLNKMIKKQEIVPPWIEKQQEVIANATTFRRRLRSDWKRHVSRSIASRGGTLLSQVKLAEDYAYAEILHSPTRKKTEQLNMVNEGGHLSQITMTGGLQTTSSGDDASTLEEEIKIMEQTFNDDGTLKSPEERIKLTTEQPLLTQAPAPASPRPASVAPFRDAQWEATERSYHDLAIKNLNSLTRSYNLMAPDLAKKPYFSLDRELLSCYADVAPQVAAAIRQRALAPKIKNVEVVGHTPGSVLSRFSVEKSRVYDEQKPQYGFKEFWRDLFASKT